MLSADPADVLLTLAEVAVAFAGFSSLIAVLGLRDQKRSRPFDLLRYWVMLEMSLAALAFALLPLVLSSLGLDDALTWRVLSAVLALFIMVHNGVLARLYTTGHPAVRAVATPASMIPANVVYISIALTQLGNASGLLQPLFGWYLLGLGLLLVVACAHFALFIAHALSRLQPPD